MALAETPASYPSLSSKALRRLWENGRQGQAIRGALESWERLITEEEDLHWLEGALRKCGLEAEAYALGAQLAGRERTNARAWEPLIRSVLRSGDPWWARQLLQEAGGDSRELQTLRIEVALTLGDTDSPALISAWIRDH